MDENPLWFDMRSAKTMNTKGDKTVLVNTTGYNSQSFLRA